nr:pentapeptide repeat-containing protein [Coleofasciculus sp. FACHB-712]
MVKVDLRLATLQDADLNWAVLQEADLSGADLRRAKLDQINLENAKLNGTQLIEAELMEANLRRASLVGANLSSANLREAHLEAANLRDAILVGTNLTEADLSSAYLRAANLTEADLHRSILIGADLSEAILNSADLSRVNLTGAYLLKASLRKAYLLRAILQDVYLLRADLSEANLRGADLRKADLSGAYLGDCTMSEANLGDAYLLESHLIRTNLDQAQLTGCCISNWHLEDVDLSKVECRYVFTRFNYATKKPTERFPIGRDFEPGEFGKDDSTGDAEGAEGATTIEVFLKEAPNWEALVFTLAQVQLDSPDLQLSIKSYQPQEEQYLLKLASSHFVNAKTLSQRVLQIYPEMLQLVESKRQAILDLLEIKVRPENPPVTLKVPPPPPPPLLPSPPPDYRLRIYQEVVKQIQLIILSQAPEQLVESVQRLLNFLKNEGISTEEIQKTMISQALVKRAKQDQTFQKQLLQWEKTADETARFSMVGESLRLAIALIWPQLPKK